MAQDLPDSKRYQILEPIGTGVVGKVYKAFDRRLRRTVALKFLRGADAVQGRRLLQEAQAQARIDHPNICKVYEVGRLGDELCIVMQFIEGKTFREAAKELSLVQKTAALRDVAEALHAAHKLGLVHRNLKPTNILIEIDSEGDLRPFLTDFGLVPDRPSPGAREEGAPLGTPQYMAPEQAASGRSQVDARTDVYGLGATFYEALTGRPPFDGASQLQILYKMLNDDPQPPQGVPQDVQRIVLQCLEKNPGHRYPSAKALAEDLQRSLSGQPVLARPPTRLGKSLRKIKPQKPLRAALIVLALLLLLPLLWQLIGRSTPTTVAVADFANETGDEGLDGLSGMLITSLEQSRKLSVLTRSRMFDLLRQAGRSPPPRIDEALGRDVAQRAQASALLLGTVRKFDNLYVIDLKMLDPRTNQYAAAFKEEGTGKQSVPAMIDRLSLAARGSLDDKPKPAAAVEQVTTPKIEAYQRYFRGEELVDRLQFSRAADQFRAALQIDGGFALASYRLAWSLMWMQDGARAREAIERAVQSAEKLPDKERLLARAMRAILFSRGDEASGLYRDCTRRWPAEKECPFMLGEILFHAGSSGRSLPRFREALVLDPAMERAHQHLIWAEQLLGDRLATIAAARAYLEAVGNDESWGDLGRAQAAAGDLDGAKRTFDKAARLFPRSPLPAADRAALLAWRFDADGAAAAVAPLLHGGRPSRDRAIGRLALGGALAQGGRIREAVRAFDEAAADARDAADPEMEAIALAEEGLARFLFLREAEGARRIAREAVARGVPETAFAFLYPLLGEIDKYGATLRQSGDPLAEKSVAAFTKRKKGEHAAAASALESLADKWPHRDYLHYLIADSWMQAREHQRAIESLSKARATFPAVTAPGPGFGGIFRARSDYQLGVLYERSGQRKLSAESTERFLKAWAKADSDLPELRDARARLARVRGSGRLESR
jgi:tetratricopeptide (TPR) repeat protein/predicted Ser/Thr protein kinase